MLLPLLFLAAQNPGLTRDEYGVPIVRAQTVDEAWRLTGRAVAEDRMWQMEMSRRLARGRLAEVLGPKYVASDREVLQTGYTEQELQDQFDRLSPPTKAMTTAYVAGINDYLGSLSNLPDGYQKAGFKPEAWTVADSMAISVRLFELFGRGGAGEIRNMAMLGYLQGRDNLKGRVLDVLDDLAWQNEPKSPTTLDPKDDASKAHPAIFPAWDRKTSERHIAMLPKLSLFDLLPGLSLENRDVSRKVAQNLNVPYKTGSYCVVVGKSRSATGYPILLSGPQMGFQTPSIVHEVSVHAPGLDVAGLDVPGLPGVLIGATPDVAWGLTSGVADTDDVVFFKTSADGTYQYDGPKQLEHVRQTLKVKGRPDETVDQLRTVDGPVVLQARGVAFARHSSYRGREVASLDALTGLYTAHNAGDVERAIRPATMSFNFFYATRGGDVGYRYMGLMPLRAPGLDYRFPIPGDPQYAWRGLVPYDQMPHVRNPRNGLLTNWNNKPAVWWPNGDTPVWGEIFHVDEVRAALQAPKLNAQDVERAAWTIARRSDTWRAFQPFVGSSLPGFDGWMLDGSLQAAVYQKFVTNLRKELFTEAIGSLVSPDYFQMVLQPSLILRAMQRRTKYDYLAGRKASDLVARSMPKDLAMRYPAPGIALPDEPAIPYSNRGTFIQVIELLSTGVAGRSVLPPGVSESGSHSRDQVPLARAWVYKLMTIR